jgi:hypothetical protein
MGIDSWDKVVEVLGCRIDEMNQLQVDDRVASSRHCCRACLSTPAHTDSSTNVTLQPYSCIESLQLPAIPRVLLRIICSLHARVQH